MGKIKIFDTLSKSEKVLDSKDEIRIYLCGVTVYDDSHIGHARTIVVFDVLRRFIESKNVRVNFIQNFKLNFLVWKACFFDGNILLKSL